MQRRPGLFLALAGLAALAARARDAGADPPPPAERAQVYSRYELETIDIALKALHARRAAAAEGKTIERIDVVPFDVFEPRDPLPTFLNVFHATTRRSVIRREVLLREGEPFRQVLVDDTIRNLRRLPELSLVIVVATEGSAPDRIGVVVITKDVWSLRAGWNVVGTPGGIETFDLAPTETNIFGTQQTIRVEYIYDPATNTFGLGYTIPRLDRTRIAAIASAYAIVNRATNSVEGSYGSLTMGEPLYSGRTPWAWDATALWQDVTTRTFENARLAAYRDVATGKSVPYEYRHREFRATYDLTRSFGWDFKQDFTLTVGVTRNVYRTDFPGADPRTVADFVSTQVPVSDTRVGPAVQYHAYSNRFLRVIDFETLALQEDFRLGADLLLGVQPSFRALGASRDVVDVRAEAQYTAAFRDGFARLFVITDTQPDLGSRRVADGLVNPGAHVVSPTVAGLGRLVFHSVLQYRYRDYLNARTTLGGGTNLRGFPTNFFVGKDLVTYSLEVRSRPIEILSCEIGAVGFYDAGDAFDGFGQLRPHQAAGAGLRILFPQLDRIVFRTDVGFPFDRPIDASTGRPIAPYQFLVTFGQAFSVPSVDPAPVLPTGPTETVPSTATFQ